MGVLTEDWCDLAAVSIGRQMDRRTPEAASGASPRCTVAASMEALS